MLRLFFVLLIAVSGVQAAHITDKLLVGFYAKPDASLQPEKVLPSGTPLEVLEKKGPFSKARLGDGKTGWIKSIYISNEKPARAMLLELQAKSSGLQSKLRKAEKALKSALAGTAVPAGTEDHGRLQQELTQTKQKLAAVDSALKNAQKETKRLNARLKKSASNGSGNQSKQLKAMKKKLASSEAELKATVYEARLLQDLLKKSDRTASHRIAALEEEVTKAKKREAESATSSASNSALIKQNAIMKSRLKQMSEILGQPPPETNVETITEDETEAVAEAVAATAEENSTDSGYGLGTWAFLITLVMIGIFVGGVAFKNYRLRQRYGGFRI